jgi:hypothetical protein
MAKPLGAKTKLRPDQVSQDHQADEPEDAPQVEQEQVEVDGQGEEKTESLGLIKHRDYPRSYRWREYDISVLESLMERVNSISARKIDATKVLRGAMLLAEKQKPEKLFDAIMEAEKQSMVASYKE